MLAHLRPETGYGFTTIGPNPDRPHVLHVRDATEAASVIRACNSILKCLSENPVAFVTTERDYRTGILASIRDELGLLVDNLGFDPAA